MSKKLLSVAINLFMSAVIAQPVNDQLCNATSLTVNAGCTLGSNVGSGKVNEANLAQPSCWTGNSYNHSVWYSFIATNDSLTIDFQPGTLSNGLLAVYSAPASCTTTPTLLTCSGGADIALTSLTVNTKYLIIIDGQSTSTGDFCIRVHDPVLSSGIGSCARPRDLYPATDCNNTGTNTFTSQNNIISTAGALDGGGNSLSLGSSSGIDGATNGTNCTDNDATQNSYWVRFTATASSQTFTNSGLGTLDYAIFTGSCGNFTPITCVSIGGETSATVNGLTAGVTYYIMITNGTSNTSNKVYLCLTSPTPYVNPFNSCTNALIVSANTVYTLNTSNATSDFTYCNGQMDNNIWVKWTCPSSWTGPSYVHLYNQDCACPNGSQVAVYSSSMNCSSSNASCEMTLNSNNGNSYGTFNPAPGATYYITIDGNIGCACTMNFAITASALMVLSTELLHFDVQPANDSEAWLTWAMTSEKNYDHYLVQRSKNAQDFETIAQVASSGEDGVKHSYDIFDTQPYEGTSYYRLALVNLSGDQKYSSVLLFDRVKPKPTLTVYPNPNAGTVYIKTAEKIADGLMNCYDAQGNCIFTTAFQSQPDEIITLELEQLKAGLYFIVVIDSDRILRSAFTKD